MSNVAFGIRGKRVTVMMSLGGQRYDLQGVTNFSAKPRQSIDSFQPSGQQLEETDLNHKGWDVEWETRKSNGTADVVLDRILSRQSAGLPREQLTITASEAFGVTGGTGGTQTYSYSEGDITVESLQFGGGDDPVSVKWKAQVKYRQRVA